VAELLQVLKSLLGFLLLFLFMVTEAAVCCGNRVASGEMLRPIRVLQRLKHWTGAGLPIKNESMGIEDDQIPS